jgi:pentatricopeptide repeat protein
LVEIDSKNESGHFLEACFQLGLSERRNPGEMKKYFDKIRKLDPQDKSGYADKMAYAEALAPFYSKDYKTVAANLEKFIKKYSKSALVPKAYFYMANCYLKARDVSKAIEAFEKLVKEYPDTSEAKKAGARLKKLKKQ